VNDHRFAADIGKRLAGQARRRHAAGMRTIAVTGVSEGWQKVSRFRAYTGCLASGKALVSRRIFGIRGAESGHMDSFEFNKVAGAVLARPLGVMAIGIIAEIIYAPGKPAKPGFEIAVAKAAPSRRVRERSRRRGAPIAVRLASADLKSGEASAKICLSCHTCKRPRQESGPEPYGVVGGPAAHMEGFPYSPAMHTRREKGIAWTFEELDKFIESPRGYVPGTLMTYPARRSPISAPTSLPI